MTGVQTCAFPILADYSDVVNRWAGPVVLGFLALAVGGYIWRVITWKPEG